MDTPQNNNSDPELGNIPQNAETFRTVPQASEAFGNLPNDSEPFRNIPNTSEGFRKVRNGSERTENHTLTVREVAKMFEQSGVPRTERSIINWSQPNRQGITRLDAFFDENEGRYYITQQSVTRAIEEEKAKQPHIVPNISEQSATAGDKSFPNQSKPEQANDSEPRHRNENSRSESRTETDIQEVADLRRKVMDLEITNRVKEQLLTRMNDELIHKDEERRTYIERLISDSHRIGELESKLLQLGAPSTPSLPKPTETFRTHPQDTEIKDTAQI